MLTCPECHRTDAQVVFTWGNRTVEVHSRNLFGKRHVEQHRVCDECHHPGRVHPECCEIAKRRILLLPDFPGGPPQQPKIWIIELLPLDRVFTCPWCGTTLPV